MKFLAHLLLKNCPRVKAYPIKVCLPFCLCNKNNSEIIAFIESVSKDPKAPLVTHRRFIGNDDYKSFIMVQEPCKDRQPDSEDEDIIKLNQEPEEIIRCKVCDFSTTRLGVLLIHNKLHLEGKHSFLDLLIQNLYVVKIS